MPERGWSCDIHVREQMHGDGVAGHPVERRDGAHRADGLRAPTRRGPPAAVPDGVVRPSVGAHGVRAGRRGEVHLRDGRLPHGHAGVLGPGRRDARHAGGVHAGRRRAQRLLRREPGGRLQPADPGGAGGEQRQHGHDLRGGGVLGGPEPAVPRGAAVGGRRRVPERVRRVRPAGVLLQRRVREPEHLPAHRLLAGVQAGVPAVVQLRLRRPHLHLHLRRRPRLHHHLLPRRHPEPQVGGRSNGHADADGAGRHRVRASGDAEARRWGQRPGRDTGGHLLARQPRHRRRVGGGDDVQEDGHDPGRADRSLLAPACSIAFDHQRTNQPSEKKKKEAELEERFWSEENIGSTLDVGTRATRATANLRAPLPVLHRRGGVGRRRRARWGRSQWGMI